MGPRPPSLKVKALQWLAQREHSPQELRAKLLRLATRPAVSAQGSSGLDGAALEAADVDPSAFDASASDAPAPDKAQRQAAAQAEIDTLLQWLGARGYLSSERFVESRINARQARFGNLRIRHELQQHGLQLDDAARQALQASEEQRARAVWQRKYGQPAADATQRVRQLRFLAGRGFSMEVVRRVVLGSRSGHSGAGADSSAITGVDLLDSSDNSDS